MTYGKQRFAKQLRRDDCAPNAIINLMKFFGVKIPYKTSYKKLYDYFSIPTFGGTRPVDLHGYLIKKSIPKTKLVDVFLNPNINKAIKIFKKERAVILAFVSKNKKAHACLMVGVNKFGFEMVNYSDKSTVQTLSFDKFQKEVLNFKKSFFYIYERK